MKYMTRFSAIHKKKVHQCFIIQEAHNIFNRMIINNKLDHKVMDCTPANTARHNYLGEKHQMIEWLYVHVALVVVAGLEII